MAGEERGIKVSQAEAVLSLEIRSRRFAFAVLEQNQILECGAREFPSGPAGRKIALKKLAFLLRVYSPSRAIARRTRRVDDPSSQSSARLLSAIRRELDRRGVPCVILKRADISEFFAGQGCPTKHDIAVHLADRFPVLREKLPRPRKKWEPEWWVLAVFDAAGTAVAYEGMGGSAPFG